MLRNSGGCPTRDISYQMIRRIAQDERVVVPWPGERPWRSGVDPQDRGGIVASMPQSPALTERAKYWNGLEGDDGQPDEKKSCCC